MNRLEATRRLVKHLTDEIVVANLGNAARDLATAGHRPQNYYGKGSMGLVSSMGLGLALAQPQRKVVVLDGDGSLLMNLGSLATIAAIAPRNLIHVVWDNEQFQLTGGQKTHTARGVNLAGVARGAGIERVAEPADEDQFDIAALADLLGNGGNARFIHARTGKIAAVVGHESKTPRLAQGGIRRQKGHQANECKNRRSRGVHKHTPRLEFHGTLWLQADRSSNRSRGLSRLSRRSPRE